MLQQYVRANPLDASHMWCEGSEVDDFRRVIKVRMGVGIGGQWGKDGALRTLKWSGEHMPLLFASNTHLSARGQPRGDAAHCSPPGP